MSCNFVTKLFQISLFLCYSAACAEDLRERLTLADGRVLVGMYDEKMGTIEVQMGASKAKLPVDATKIVTRERVTPDVVIKSPLEWDAEKALEKEKLKKQLEQDRITAAAALLQAQQDKIRRDKVAEAEAVAWKENQEKLTAAAHVEQNRLRELAINDAQIRQAMADQHRLEEEQQVKIAQQAVVDQANSKAQLARDKDKQDRFAAQQAIAEKTAQAQVRDRENAGRIFFGLILFLIFVGATILPWFLARRKKHRYTYQIALTNLFPLFLVVVCAVWGSLINKDIGNELTRTILGVIWLVGWFASLIFATLPNMSATTVGKGSTEPPTRSPPQPE